MESFFKKPAYVFIGSIVLALLILFTTLFHEYKTSADINNDEQLKDFIAQNIPLSLNKVIAKKIVSDKVYILYEFSSPEQKPGMIVLKKKTLLKNRYGFFLNSWSSDDYNKAIYKSPDFSLVVYYGLKGKDASYYKVKYKGQEKKIFIDKDYILDVYANDENLFSDYCARVFNDKDESICIF